jgi:hypothetical protein
MANGSPNAAVAAISLKAKLSGLLIERKEVGAPGDFDKMSDDKLPDYVSREAAALGIGLPASGRIRPRVPAKKLR